MTSRYHAARLRCLTSLERWGDAEDEATWIFMRSAGVGTDRLAIARFHAARGQTSEAIGHLQAALGFWSDADPEYIPAQEACALLEELQGT